MPCPHLEAAFPNLGNGKCKKKSEQTPIYNCIAFAASETHRRWWPSDDPRFDYWPLGVREETVDAFVRAFKTLGYETCEHGRLELGYEKVAIYALDEAPTHMARQRFRGDWISKLGNGEDIVHGTLEQIETYGPYPPVAEYGRAVHFMKRGLIVFLKVRIRQWRQRKHAIQRKHS